MSGDPWHFPRPEIAREYLAFFESGISNTLVLFAPRRYGKTEFCLEDLAPAAEKAAYRVAYASFWQASLSPLPVLLYTLEKSLESRSFSERARALLTHPVTKLKLSGALAGAEGEVEVDLSTLGTKPPADLLLYLADLGARLARRRGRFLLILDEVQELATDPKNAALIAALRTLLDTHRRQLKVVLTGSSEEGLRRMFNERAAPFFHFGTRLEFPRLGKHFVSHVLRAFKAASGRTLTEPRMIALFDALNQNPYYFRKVLEAMLAQPRLDIDRALSLTRERLALEQGYPRLWSALKPFDRELLRVLARGERSLFGAQARQAIGRALGGETPQIGAVQSSLRRLDSVRIVHSSGERGSYIFEDEEFAQWIRHHLAEH